MKVILAGGGTGGHFFPLIALAQSLTERNIEVLIIGRKESWEERSALKSNLSFRGISTEKRAGKFSLQNIKAVLKLVPGLFETLGIFRDFSPEVVVSSGGYVSVPVLVAAILKGRPILIQEPNIFPGLTTRFFAPLVKEISLSFQESAKYFSQRLKKKIFITGSPLRQAVRGGKKRQISDQSLSLEEDKFTPTPFQKATAVNPHTKSFGVGVKPWMNGVIPSLKRETGKATPVKVWRFTLLVMGGSQGAHRINELVLEAQKIWEEEYLPIQTIHLTGERDYAGVREGYRAIKNKSYINSFYEKMAELYSIADLAIARAGALTLAELAYWGIPAILIPYPYALEKHQELNAEFFSRQGAAQVLREKDLTPEILAEAVRFLVEDKAQLKQMSEASRSLGRRNSTEILTERIIRLAIK